MLENAFMILRTSNEVRSLSAWLGLIAGVWGILYGLKAKHFTAYGHLSSREPERFAPTWRYRLFVISIASIALLTPLFYLLKLQHT
jgi:hypothetical protein